MFRTIEQVLNQYERILYIEGSTTSPAKLKILRPQTKKDIVIIKSYCCPECIKFHSLPTIDVEK